MALKIHHNLKIFSLLLLVVLMGTFLDWVAHSVDPVFAVSSEYFRNKIIYATAWGLLATFLLRRMENIPKKAVLISAFIALMLQIKYFLQGYDLYFVFLFMFLHFLMFLAPMWIVFKNFPELFSGDNHPR